MNKKHILVTGAAGGIGSATCQLLMQEGHLVFALDKIPIKQHDLAPGALVPLSFDIAVRDHMEALVTTIKKHTDHLDGLVNIAGTFDQFALVEADMDRFRNLVDSNFTGHQLLTQALFPLLMQVKGRIINLSSEMVLSPMPLQAYGFSKKLFEVWSDQLRLELELLGMKVIKIRPGGHSTSFINRSIDVLSDLDEDSIYRNIHEKAKERGVKMLQKVNKDPRDVAVVILKSIKDPRPARVYHVNISWLFRSLSIIPTGTRERLLIATMRKWIKKKPHERGLSF